MDQNYESYGISDFVSDDDFLRHHLFPTEASTIHWNAWLRRHPHKKEEWEQASKLLEAVRLGLSDYARTYLSEEAENQLLRRILETNALPTREAGPPPARQLRSRWVSYAGVAAAVALIIAGWAVFDKNRPHADRYRQLTESHAGLLDEKINTGSEPIAVLLPDSSRVNLSPGSRISFSKSYGTAERVVYLSGGAEFDVTRNPAAPFLVYANEIVTRVLGTRFTVTAFESDRDITVRVATGKVSVYRNGALTGAEGKKGVQQELVLIPNQQAVFVKAAELFSKSLVPEPEVVIPAKKAQPSFVYNETPAGDVFADLQDAYGIEIVYDAEALGSCQLTASLSEESFEEKLDIICKSISATHQVVDARIIITAKGCK